MITRFFTWQIASESTVAHVCQVVCSITGGVVLVAGFWRLAELELTQHQLFLDTVATLLLAGLFVVLGLLCQVWRRAV